MSVISIYGPTGTFKSTFAFTMPGRSSILDLEYGIKRASWRFPDSSKYDVWQPSLPDADDVIQQFMLNRINKINPMVAGKRELFETIVRKFVFECTREDIDNIVIDTTKVLWDSVLNSYLQELQEGTEKSIKSILAGDPNYDQSKLPEPRQQLGRMDYRTPNDRMRQFFNTATSFNKHLVLISHERPVRKAMYNPQTKKEEQMIVPGEFEIDSFNETAKRSDWVLETRKDDNGIGVYAIIRKSPIGPSFIGVKLQTEYTGGIKGYDFNVLDKLVTKIDRVTLV